MKNQLAIDIAEATESEEELEFIEEEIRAEIEAQLQAENEIDFSTASTQDLVNMYNKFVKCYKDTSDIKYIALAELVEEELFKNGVNLYGPEITGKDT